MGAPPELGRQLRDAIGHRHGLGESLLLGAHGVELGLSAATSASRCGSCAAASARISRMTISRTLSVST
jgi:hypothetical protein